jgi:hypothetical protein
MYMKKILNVLGIVCVSGVVTGPMLFLMGGMRDIRPLQIIGACWFVLAVVVFGCINRFSQI